MKLILKKKTVENYFRNIMRKNLILLFIFMFVSSCIYSASFDLEIKKSIEIGRMASSTGKIKQAISHYSSALEKAMIFDDSFYIGKISYELAVCHFILQEYENAMTLLENALFEEIMNPQLYGKIILLKAKIEKKRGNTDLAFKLANAVLEIKNSEQENIMIETRLFLAELACDANNLQMAEKELLKIKKIIRKKGAGVRGLFNGIYGRLMFLRNEYSKAAKYFEQMTIHFKRAGNVREMIKGLEFSGNSYLKLKQFEKAACCFFRAARSLFALKKKEKANLLIQKIKTFEDKISDSLKNRMKLLLKH